MQPAHNVKQRREKRMQNTFTTQNTALMSCISVNHNPQRTQAGMLDFGVTVMSTEFTFLHTCILYANLPCPLSLCFP